MSYVQSYNMLHAAFESGAATEATLADAFLPNPAMPDLALPMGKKIEKVEPVRVGDIALTHTCKVVQIDPEQLSQVIDPHAITTWQGQPTPTMLLKQSLDWTQEVGGVQESHHTRLFRGFTEGEMVWGDKAWEQYHAERSAWLDAAGLPSDTPEFDILPDDPDYPLAPLFFNVHVKTSVSGGDASLHDHAKVVAATAQVHPQLGVLSRFDKLYGTEVYEFLTPAHFLAMTRGLIERPQA